MVCYKTYIDNLLYIYKHNPKYVEEHDSIDECDCIGMVRRALKMDGNPANGLTGTNYAARYTVKNFRKINSVSQLKEGDVVFIGRPNKHNDLHPLPSKYLKGGSLYNGDLTNYIHIGTVIKINPLEIIHMTNPSAMIDTILGKWNYVGQLPQISYTEESEVVIMVEYATVTGGSLNLRKEKSTGSTRLTSIPSGSKVAVISNESEWCKIVYNSYTGYVLTKYLKFESGSEDTNVTITLSRDNALALFEALKLSLDK